MLKHKTQIVRKSVVVVCLLLLAAGCSPLGGGGSGGTTGVAKTINGGTDWTLSNKAEVPQDTKKKKKKEQPVESTLASSAVLSMELAPDSSQHLYAATQGQGLFYTENGADTWKQVLTKFNAFDLVIDPGNTEHIFVAGQAGGQARVLATINRGKSWDEVYNDAASQNAARAIAMDPFDSKSLVVGLGSGNLIASKDSGATWSLIQNFQDPVSQIVWHTNRTLYILTRGKGLYVSQDGGVTVQNISKQLLNIDEWRQRAAESQGNDRTSVAETGVPSTQTSSFFKVAIGSANPRLLYIAANNGLFSSQDAGATWNYLKLPLRNTQTTEVRGLALADQDKLLYASVGNTVFKTVNAGGSWQVTAIATPATINYILVDPQVNQIAYAGFIPTQQ